MADKFEIELKVAADVADIKKATTELNAFKSRLDGLQNQIRQGFQLNTGAGIGNQIKGILSSAIPAYGKQEEAERRLANAMAQSGLGAKANVESFKRLASQIQQVTTIGDEAVMGMQALALNMGVDASRMQECVEGAIGLQRAYGMGLNEAMKASAAVVQGKTEKLNELIPALSQCETNEERLAMAQKAMRNGFEQAKGDVSTLNGAIEQLKNSWGDVAEVLGEAVAPVVKEACAFLNSLAQILTENKTAVIFLTRALIGLGAAVGVAKLAAYLKVLKSMGPALLKAGVEAKAASVAMANFATSATAATSTLGKFAVGARGLVGALNPLGLAITAAGAAIVYLLDKYDDLKEAQKNAQDMFDRTASSAVARSRERIDEMRREGATFEEVCKNEQILLGEIDGLLRQKKLATDEGYETAPIEAAIEKHREMLQVIRNERGEYENIYDARMQAYADTAYANVSTAKGKRADTKLSDAQKLARVKNEISEKSKTIADLEKQIEDAQGERQVQLSEIYKAETDNLIALERERGQLQKNVDAQKKARQDEKKAQQDRAAAKAREIGTARQRLAQIQSELAFENEVNLALIQGNSKEVERLENKKKIADIARQLVDAGRTRYTTADELKKLEHDALETAKRKVDLENQALRAEREKARIKENEQSVEDYIYRIKVAQARIKGDDREVARLTEQRESKREVDALVGKGFDRAQAENMVRKTRAAESQAREKESGRAEAASAAAGGARERKRPATVSEKYADIYDDFQAKKASGEIASDASWEKFRNANKKSDAPQKKKNRQAGGANVAALHQSPLGLGAGKDNLQPPSPPANKDQQNNPASEAGGKTEDSQAEILSILGETKDILDKVNETLTDVKNNTAMLATKK